MIQELLYTSAPNGLRPGSSGYCTVQVSRNTPAQTIDLLESLSGYRHHFQTGSAEAAQNPVNFGHYQVRLHGGIKHILSRVSDYHLDHTGRSNKIAHHLVISSPQSIPAGPAWPMKQSGWLLDQWDGEVKMLEERPLPLSTVRDASICHAWQRATGDAGWAGVLADFYLTHPRQKAFLIYRPGLDVLSLIEEALALLPPSRRWDVTFCTYGAALPATVECTWVGVLSGSQEEQLTKRFAGALRIDLTTIQGLASESGPLIELARTGIIQTPSGPTESTKVKTAVIAANIETIVTPNTAILPTKKVLVLPEHSSTEVEMAPPPVRRHVIQKKRSQSISLTTMLMLVIFCCLLAGGAASIAYVNLVHQDNISAQIAAIQAERTSSGELHEHQAQTPHLLDDVQEHHVGAGTTKPGSAISEDERDSAETDKGLASIEMKEESQDKSGLSVGDKNHGNAMSDENKNDSTSAAVEEQKITPEESTQILYGESNPVFKKGQKFSVEFLQKQVNAINDETEIELLFPRFNGFDLSQYDFPHDRKNESITISDKHTNTLMNSFRVRLDTKNLSCSVEVNSNLIDEQIAILIGLAISLKNKSQRTVLVFSKPIEERSISPKNTRNSTVYSIPLQKHHFTMLKFMNLAGLEQSECLKMLSHKQEEFQLCADKSYAEKANTNKEFKLIPKIDLDEMSQSLTLFAVDPPRVNAIHKMRDKFKNSRESTNKKISGILKPIKKMNSPINVNLLEKILHFDEFKSQQDIDGLEAAITQARDETSKSRALEQSDTLQQSQRKPLKDFLDKFEPALDELEKNVGKERLIYQEIEYLTSCEITSYEIQYELVPISKNDSAVIRPHLLRITDPSR